jgi:hypothetical protein
MAFHNLISIVHCCPVCDKFRVVQPIKTSHWRPLSCSVWLLAVASHCFSLQLATAQAPSRAKRPSAVGNDSALLDRLQPAVPSQIDRPGLTPRNKLPLKPRAIRRIEPSAATLKAETSVLEANYLTIDHGYATNSREAEARRACITPPNNAAIASGFELVPIEICTTIQTDGGGALVLPCPRDVVDQLHVGCHTSVVRQKMSGEEPVPHKARIVYTQANSDTGYINPFVYIDLPNTVKGSVAIRTLHWVVVADYSKHSAQQADIQAIVQTIQEPLLRAAAIRYDIELQIDDVGDQPTRGDCSVKAFVARTKEPLSDGSRIEVVEGYRYRLPDIDVRTGGCHFQNLVVAPAGLFMFDATSKHDYYLGPPKQFITTCIGGEFILPATADPPDTFRRGSNRGFYSKFKSHGNARLSTPTFGDRAATLAKQATSPPPAIAHYAAALWQDHVGRAYRQ